MKSPQGREAKKPKKPKVKAQAKVFEDTARKTFQVPKSAIDDKSERAN